MTVLNISQETLIMLPAGSTGGLVKMTYNGTTVGPVIGSGFDQGRAVITTGRLAKLTALDGESPLQLVGRESGGRKPATVTLRIYPTYPPGVDGPPEPLTLTGMPIGAPDQPGIWDLSNINDTSGGMDVITPAERQQLARLLEGVIIAQTAAEETSQMAAERVAQVDDVLANLTQTTSEIKVKTADLLAAAPLLTDAQAAAAARPAAEAAAALLPLVEQNTQQAAVTLVAAHQAITQLGTISTLIGGVQLSGTDTAPLGGSVITLEAAPNTTLNATSQPAPSGGILLNIGGQ